MEGFKSVLCETRLSVIHHSEELLQRGNTDLKQKHSHTHVF